LIDTVMYAHAYKQRSTTLALLAASASRSAPWSSARSWSNPSATTPANSSASAALAASNWPIPTKKLSLAEIADRHAKGLCFRCDDKFVPGHKEECMMLFIIEVIGDEEEDEDPTISVHALTKIQSRTSTGLQVDAQFY
jgi:hypothetical protein